MNIGTKVNEIRIIIYPKDYSRSRQFYTSIMKWPIQTEWDRDDSKGVMFDTGCGIIELMWEKERTMESAPFNLSLRVDNVWSLWKTMNGDITVVFPLRQNSWGDDSFCIADPDGCKLTFFSEGGNRTGHGT